MNRSTYIGISALGLVVAISGVAILVLGDSDIWTGLMFIVPGLSLSAISFWAYRKIRGSVRSEKSDER